MTITEMMERAGKTISEINKDANQWIITKDHIDDGQMNGVKSCGFIQGVEMPVRFKMYDDDNNLYFEGVMQQEDFEPLDDFGMPGYGCTYLKTSKNGAQFSHL